MIEIGKLNALGLWWFLCRWESAMAVNGDPWCVSGAMCHWCWRCGHTFLAALTRPFSGYRGCDHRPGISPAAGSGPRPAGHMVPTLVTVTARLTTASLAHTSCFYTVYSLPSQWLQMKCNIGFISLQQLNVSDPFVLLSFFCVPDSYAVEKVWDSQMGFLGKTITKF